MASTSIKSTYSLDVETVRQLERMASHLGVSKSEALRRAIRAAARENALEERDAVAALDELQRALDLSDAAAREWARRAEDERRAGSRRREATSG
ncbi:MAG: ribbon-helix-helix protein, CopG family [Acidobacteriota bacterium]|nr:ribbon-helix-helix protein, CopG family [Acidobacteriota bacterium]